MGIQRLNKSSKRKEGKKVLKCTGRPVSSLKQGAVRIVEVVSAELVEEVIVGVDAGFEDQPWKQRI